MSSNGEPTKPTASSDLAETASYLRWLSAGKGLITVRELLGYWGRRSRGSRVVAAIAGDLSEMGYMTEPPFDSGPLDGKIRVLPVSIGQAPSRLSTGTSGDSDTHMLRVSRIPAANFAIRADGETVPGMVSRGTLVADAVTTMLRHDYSQLPVVESAHDSPLVGVFSWRSYGEARLRGRDCITVDEAMEDCAPVDLHSDLLASASSVSRDGYAIVVHMGRLAGIVTASDLIDQFGQLATPFLALGRCEQELRRVATAVLPPQASGEPYETMRFYRLQETYKRHADRMGWGLSAESLDRWIGRVRDLRNTVAHFDDQDADRSEDIQQVQQLTRWLRGIDTATLLDGKKGGASTVAE